MQAQVYSLITDKIIAPTDMTAVWKVSVYITAARPPVVTKHIHF